MSVSPRFWAFAVAIPLAAAALLFVPGRGYTGQHGTVLAAESQAAQLEVFGIASSRTIFLPSPPAGKVTIQLLATAVNAEIPGEFKFYLAAPEVSEVFTTVSAPKGQSVPKGQELQNGIAFVEPGKFYTVQELQNGIAFVEPGKFYTVQVVYENPTDREIEFLVGAPQIDPVVALPFARAICWCAAIPFSAPAGGAFYRTLKVGVGPNTPIGAKAIVEWPVILLSE